MRRVVGADHADDAPLEAADQRLPVCRAADGWKHLHGASHVVEVLRGQQKELGARLDAEGGADLHRVLRGLQAQGAGQVRDVQVRARFPGHRGRRRNGDRLRLGRPGFEKVVVGQKRASKRGQHRRVFRMDGEREPKRCHDGSQPCQRSVIGRRFEVWVFVVRRIKDLFPAQAERVSEVSLESDRACIGHRLELLRGRARPDEAPQPEVDLRLAVRKRRLRLQHTGAIDRRHRVRHVQHDGDPARGRGSGHRREVLFLRKARVAAVDVDVHRARQHVHAVHVDLSAVGADRKARLDADDGAVADMHVGVAWPVRRVDRPALDEELSQVRVLESGKVASKECRPRGCFLRPLLHGPAPRPGGSLRVPRRAVLAPSAASRRRW